MASKYCLPDECFCYLISSVISKLIPIQYIPISNDPRVCIIKLFYSKLLTLHNKIYNLTHKHKL